MAASSPTVPDVVAAVFHAASAERDVVLVVVELDDASEPVIRWSNRRASELFGLASSDLEGRWLSDYVSGAEDAPFPVMFRRERPTTTAVTLRTAVGETLACRVGAVPAPDGRLWTLRVHPAHSDRELELRASADAHEQRFRVLAERSPVPTMMSEQGMRLGHVNDALCALLGVPADKLTGTGWTAYAHHDDLNRITDTVVAVLAGQEREIEARFVDSHRRVRYTDMRFTPLRTPGVGDGFVATLEDITERRALQEQLQYQATHDALTGLPLRPRLWEHIAATMEGPAVTRAVVSLAHNLGIGVVAEGVETQHQMRLLEAMRCADIQGFGISRPLAHEAFVVWCRSGYPQAWTDAG